MKLSPVSIIEPYLKVLVYGAPGAGKTTLACSGHAHPKMGKTVVANIEGGMLSVSKTSALTTDQLRTMAELEELFACIAHRKAGFEDVRTIVIDSGTELQTVLLDEIVDDASKRGGKARTGPDDVQLQDYGTCTKRMQRLFRQFRDLPCHVIVTALVREVFPPATRQRPNPAPVTAHPDFTRKLSNSVMGYFDHVWYMWREDDKHYLLTQDAGIHRGKTRGPNFAAALGPKVENPNLGVLLDTLIKTQGQS
jgi:hypothetical protein